MSKKVLVALSGGVDSSVAALLLKEQGYDVVGAHMKLWDYIEVGGDSHRDGRCCSLDSINDCRMICDMIDAPFYVLNLSKEFKETVIDNFVSEYRAGRTPNPCVLCNTDIKWAAFLEKAKAVGCDYIATGHYAFVDKTDNGRYLIRKGVDGTRDQSYVLWGVSQEALSVTLMPLGGLRKTEVRKIAHAHKLRTADKKESREICFVADDNYRRFLREWQEKQQLESLSGAIVHEDGQQLGEHEGAEMFTIGQRKKLGVTYPTPLYVQSINAASGEVVVGQDQSLYKSELFASGMNWVGLDISTLSTDEPFEVEAKIRYLHAPALATISLLPDKRVSIDFKEKQRAITPGQSVVFYDGDVLLGGGLIE